MPSPELPEGWKAAWNDMHGEWFYINTYTSQTTWEMPTAPALPSINKTVHSVDPSRSPVTSQTRMDANISATASHDPWSSDKVAVTSPHDLRNSDEVPVTRAEDDLAFEKEILADFDIDGSETSSSSVQTSDRVMAWSRRHSCRVLIKRYSKVDPAKIAAAQREINVLHALAGTDNTIPPLLDYFDPANTIFIVCEDRKDESLRRYIEGRGPLTGDLLKAVVTQLMSALAHIFMNGFAHLRMCDETLFIDQNGQLTVKDFQYAVPYSLEKTDTLYAAVGHDVSRAEGIWCAPEVYAAEQEGTQYNGRKAVIWSCGVVIYYMATGQLEKLSSLAHPAFANRHRPTITNHDENADNATPLPVNDNTTLEASKPRRLSLAYRRRSSAANTTAPSHSRKSSMSAIPTPQTMVSYPGNRFDVQTYARDIISNMIVMNPNERAELIGIAAKVPKEFASKATRPLMELAWLDYKNHVGPYAGMGLGAEEWNADNGDASSMYSGISSLSQSFTGLLSGRRTSKSGGDNKGRYAGW